jgi:hypothetical protein
MSAKYWPRDNPALFEINTIAWLWELAQKLGKTITLGQVPGSEWDLLKTKGMDFIWLMGVWKRSPRGRLISLNSSHFRASFETVLPGFKDKEIIGSPYAVQSYQPDPRIGSWDELKIVQHQLHQRGMGLILDFVPNHTAIDHPWVSSNPEYYILGSAQDYQNQPESYFKVETKGQNYYVAHGRDPNYPPWTDTAQINFFNPDARAALIKQVRQISQYCDGLRCDMAMLVMNDIFQRVWGRPSGLTSLPVEFWIELTQTLPELIYIAEAYWDTEWALQQMGFSFVYDKRLYDRLKNNPAVDIYSHLKADITFQSKLVRFIENHDEARSLEAFGAARVKPAAALYSLLPGMKLYFHGQLQGRRVKLPVQLSHARVENADLDIESFYNQLLAAVNDDVAHRGLWKLKAVYPHADENSGNLIACTRQLHQDIKLVIVNFSSQPAQGRIVFQDDIQESLEYLFIDRLNGERFTRQGVWMAHPGLIFELSGYQASLFDISPSDTLST